MARPIVLSNGELHVGINMIGMVHDFYYPYVGLENHTSQHTLRHKIGVYVDGALHWIDNGEWRIDQNYLGGTLIGHTLATNDTIGLALEFDDFVDSEVSAFERNIHIINLRDNERDVKLFMHQIFIIADARNNRDTAQYLPENDAILQYKGNRAFVIGGEKAKYEGPFDSFSIGLSGIEGHEGVWRDAEDGELARNTVEHGQVDSILQFNIHLTAHDSERVFYWIACGKSMHEAIRIHELIRANGLVHRLIKTDQFWRKWAKNATEYATKKLPQYLQKNFVQSVLILKSHIDRRGAIIASTDSGILKQGRDYYGYCWPRDAAYVLWPLLRLGYYDEVTQFMNFARRVLSEDGYFMHKFQSDGSLGSSWHSYVHDGEIGPPIQADETASVLFLYSQLHAARPDANMMREFYPTFVRPMANFLSGYVDRETKLPHATYDLWEERYLTTTYSTAVIVAALGAAADLAEENNAPDDAVRWRAAAGDMVEAAEALWDEEAQYFRKGLRHFPDGHVEQFTDFDISAFYGAYMYGLWSNNSDKVEKAYKSLERRFDFSLQNPRVPRYEFDEYFRSNQNGIGNPWFVTSLWLAQYNIGRGNYKIAASVINWANDFMSKNNILSEQVDPDSGQMVSVAPLAWSHAEFVSTLLDLGKEGRDAISA